jgi:hypothetical protein
MQISSSYNSQITSLIRDTALGKTRDGSKNDTGNETPPKIPAPISFSPAYMSLQNTLSGLSVDSASSSSGNSNGAASGIYGFPFSSLSPTVTNAQGQTLGGLQAASQTYNPADWLTDSDKSLFAQVTGSTIKDGVIYKADGSVDNSDESFGFADQLFTIRNEGAVDDMGNRYAITGDITAQDLQNVIAQYRSFGDRSSANYQFLQKGLAALS